MKKIFAAIVFFNLLGLSLNAQVLLLKLNLNDCAKCQMITGSYVNSKFSDIPSFLVFPVSMQEDSTDIKKRITDSYLNKNIVFNDYYYHLLDKVNASSIGYLSKSGKIEYQVSLLDINQDFVKKVDSLYASDDIVKTEFPIWNVFKGNKQIKYNRSLGYVKVVDSTGSLKYELDNNIVQQSIKAIDKANPHFYDYTTQSKDKEAYGMFLTPKMGGFSLYGDNGYFIVRVPYEKLLDTPVNGDNVKITYKYSLVSKKGNGDISCYPIVADYYIKNKKAYYVLDYFSLEALNDTTFLIFYYPSDWKLHKEEREYIAVFKLRKGMLEYEKHLANRIPDIYIDAGIGYAYATNMECTDYPFHIPIMSTEIMNLENGKNYKFNLPKVDFSQVDSNFVKKAVANKIDNPIFNTGIFKDVKRNNLYLISCIAKTYYLTTFNLKTMTVKSSVDLNSKGLNVKSESIPYSYVYYDKEKDIFLIESKDNVLRAIPSQILTN